MDFKSFSELRKFIRRYNSTSILEIGTNKCWCRWEAQYSNPVDWVRSNTERNCTIRIMLLASAGNPHKQNNLSTQGFDNLINVYHKWDKYTILDKHLLSEEAKTLMNSILQWENIRKEEVRNWSIKLSDILDSEAIYTHTDSFFLQRLVAFQNAGFGHSVYRIYRTIKFIKLLDKQSKSHFSDDFFNHIGLTPLNYFRHFLACLGFFSGLSGKKGFCNFHQLPNIDDQLQKLGIGSADFKLFVQQNSIPFSEQTDTSFRHKVNQTLDGVPDYYQPFFCNRFLEIPLIELKKNEFCLPDPFSFTESCWNQVGRLLSKSGYKKKLSYLLSHAFEDYLKDVLLPFICPTSFERISEVENPSSSNDKRADFLIRTSNSYIILECKSSVMNAETSAYLQADKIADLWSRIHSASEQIARTVKALNLYDKPVIPLILTFYDSIAASTVFEQILKETDYCSRLGLNMPPIVYSLHEFEHWISDRSLNNWSELILKKQNSNLSVKPDNEGHNYGHLNDVSIL